MKYTRPLKDRKTFYITEQRRRILYSMLLAEEHLTVVDICWLSGVPLSTVRASIRTLEHFGWVEGSESIRGQWRYYYVPKHKRYEIEQSVI